MSPSFMKKTMVYLGLLDDEYDEYDDLEDRAPRGFSAATSRVEPQPRSTPEYDQASDEFSGGMSRVRTIPRESAVPAQPKAAAASVAPRPTPSPVRAMPVESTLIPSAAPAMSSGSARVHVVAPSRFGDAKEIADRLKDSRPVIVNLQMADRDLQRRMIDFCSGVTYALSGEMEKVADQVFLLAPTNVKVSDEERQRLADRGFGRD
jgi:cell division inhibitor SepF